MDRGGHRNHGGWNRNNRGRGGGPPWRNGNPFHQGFNKGGPNRNHRGNFRGSNQNRFNNSFDRNRDRSPSNSRAQNSESRDKDTRSLPSTQTLEPKKTSLLDSTPSKTIPAETTNSNSNSNFLGIGYGSDDDDDELDDGLKIDEGSTEEDAHSEKAAETVPAKDKTMAKSDETSKSKNIEETTTLEKEGASDKEPKAKNPSKSDEKEVKISPEKSKTSEKEKTEEEQQIGKPSSEASSTGESVNNSTEKMEKVPPPPPSKPGKKLDEADDGKKKKDSAAVTTETKEKKSEEKKKAQNPEASVEKKAENEKSSEEGAIEELSAKAASSGGKVPEKKKQDDNQQNKTQPKSENNGSGAKALEEKEPKKSAENELTKNDILKTSKSETLKDSKEPTPAQSDKEGEKSTPESSSEPKKKNLKEAAKDSDKSTAKADVKSSPKKEKTLTVIQKSPEKMTDKSEKTPEKPQKEAAKKSQEVTKSPIEKKETRRSSQSSEKTDSEKKPPPPPPKKTEKTLLSDEKISSKKSISLNNLLKEKEKELSNSEKSPSPKITPEKSTRTRPERTPPESKRKSSDLIKKEQTKIDRFMTSKQDQGTKVNDISEKLKKQKEVEAETGKSSSAEGRRSERSSRRSTGSRRDSSSRSPERKIEKDNERRKKDDKPKVLSEDIFDREVEKSLGEKKSLRAFSRPDPQKRSSSSMEPDDEKQPEAKKSRTELSPSQDGLMSPTRTKVTSLQERRSSVTKKESPSPTELNATALDLHPSADGSNDFYCWSCHLEGKVVCCDVCPRVYHEKCLPKVQKKIQASERFFCPECTRIEEAENLETRVESMKNVSLHNLSIMLRNCLSKIRPPGIEIFMQPVDTQANPNYLDYIFHPMDMSQIEANIKEKKYGSTDAFLADLKWIKHNCIIFNGAKNDFSTTANKIIRIAETECQEIENCPSCYLGPLTKPVDWFVQVCDKVHPIVWGKLSGYPVWPAKVMCCQSKGSGDSKTSRHHVDIRFFGQHDKAWLSVTHVTMHTSEDPYTRPGCPKANKQKKEFEEAIRELKQYIANLERKYGKLKRFPPKTPFDPEKHFDVKNLFEAVPGNVLAKIPPLRKEPRANDKIKTLIKGVSTIINPKSDKQKSADSDDSANGAFDFPSDDDSDDGNKLIISDEASKEDVKKRKPKSEPARAPKRLRSDSPAETTAQQQKSKLRTESPISEKSAPPPPPPEGKNAYHRQEKERKEAIKRGRERPPPRSTPEPKVLEPPNNTPKNGKEKSKGAAKENSRLGSASILSEIQGLKALSSTIPRDLSPSLNTLPVSGLPPNVSMGQYQDRIMGHFEHIIKQMYGEMLSSLEGGGQAEALRLEVDRLKWQHEMELADMRHNNELTIAEIRQSMENEKNLEIERLEAKLRKEQEEAILATKSKQWCAQCGKEAVFYCCWNTAYCDYPCQQGHWPVHMEHCTQSQGGQPPK
ncbi:Oidioi.mRNA.OKI2018_I69.XSR.g15450.t2.cds [Oikopleura dioica]|uniref:Oidioi.mRNA.OKI2018_I69.XSR.g15450.t2.cds n=1 Tax=Oikopleura dioica TaxID=34765 RepID=A0ABN7SCX1_OIKDI|nr:Oidioi.mRNA.OKI2018_I69.XSR.g15450.t2.cds [Oikopleura dioica]